MKISVDLIKQLRDRTGAGIGGCKNALVEANGDLEKAYDLIRAKGEKTAQSKSVREATEGKVAVQTSADSIALVEVNCETDFVSKGDKFQKFADDVAKIALDTKSQDVETLLKQKYEEGTVEEARVALVGWVGENIQIPSVRYQEHEGAFISVYRHGDKLVCGVFTDVDNEAVGRDVGMHIVALNPLSILPENVPSEILDREKALFASQTEKMGKPELAEKIIKGKVAKFLKEVCLLDQDFVKDTNLTVKSYLAQSNARVIDFIRVELG